MGSYGVEKEGEHTGGRLKRNESKLCFLDFLMTMARECRVKRAFWVG
jgi:hypothetical protein